MVPLRKLYRPENTVQGERDLLTLRSDINEVFWSEDLEVIPAKWVEGKCIVRPKQVLSVDPVQWHEAGNFRFYFEKRYDSRSQSFHDLEGDVIKKFSNPSRYPEEEGRHPEVRLFIFSLSLDQRRNYVFVNAYLCCMNPMCYFARDRWRELTQPRIGS